MLSGYLYWGNGGLYDRGAYGLFWSSTPYIYAASHSLDFRSPNVTPKGGNNKPYGFTLRCVARFFRTSTYAQKIIVPFLPELSAAFLFRLCCRAVSTGSVVISAIEVRAATSGHLRLTPTRIHGSWSSTPLILTLKMATISQAAIPSAASPSKKHSSQFLFLIQTSML